MFAKKALMSRLNAPLVLVSQFNPKDMSHKDLLEKVGEAVNFVRVSRGDAQILVDIEAEKESTGHAKAVEFVQGIIDALLLSKTFYSQRKEKNIPDNEVLNIQHKPIGIHTELITISGK